VFLQEAIIGVCRDLRGITEATNSASSFGALFQCLYPTYFPVFTRVAMEWADTPAVTTPLLKFLLEFVNNKVLILVNGGVAFDFLLSGSTPFVRQHESKQFSTVSRSVSSYCSLRYTHSPSACGTAIVAFIGS
jgi:hypothetical protein